MEILTTPRLRLRTLTPDDRASVAEALQDEKTMYAYEHAFSDAEVDAWMEKMFARYERDGFGWWAVIRRSDGAFLGQCGLSMQRIPAGEVAEVGYVFARRYWHNGYATEAAIACREYAFTALGLSEVYSIIRENNLPSRHVAERGGMRIVGSMTKFYHGVVMPHLIYRIDRPRR